jgi:hypothetical protein
MNLTSPTPLPTPEPERDDRRDTTAGDVVEAVVETTAEVTEIADATCQLASCFDALPIPDCDPGCL